MRTKAWIRASSGTALLVAMSLSGFPIAQSAPPPSSPSNNDQELLKLSAQGNIAEVELGRFAITRSTNPAVLNLGTRLAQDGSEGVANLQTVAAMLHVQLPMTPGPAQEGQIAKLRQLHGAAFDKRFAQIAHKDESQMLHQFQAGLTMAANGAVKSTIENMIPIVKEHLQIAQGIPASTSKSAMR